MLRHCCHSWNAENASPNRVLRNGGKRRPYPRELARVEACQRLRPPEPICASTEINSSAVKLCLIQRSLLTSGDALPAGPFHRHRSAGLGGPPEKQNKIEQNNADQ